MALIELDTPHAMTRIDAAPTRSGALPTSGQTLRDLVINADLLPNTHHLETGICKTLGIKRTEASHSVRQLEREGLVVSDQRDGFWISPVSTERMSAVFNRLGEIEGQAAYRLAKFGPQGKAPDCGDEAVALLEEAMALGDLNQIANACGHFHQCLLRSCGDQGLTALANELRDDLHRARMLCLRLTPVPHGIVTDYRRTLEIIASGNASLAYRTQRSHWLRTSRRFANLLARHEMDSIVI